MGLQIRARHAGHLFDSTRSLLIQECWRMKFEIDMAARQLSEWFGPARVGSRSKL
ncbi:hypothetical protein L208DRAFT_1407718 [Tricholoma matsutake]|nr:hypothetical protein L208DRAFT_1407718 [Tricholoma matsutake 945]